MSKPNGIQAAKHPDTPKKISMHEDIPVWYDCCSCEAEPYWARLAEETEADLSNREDVDAD